MMLQRECIWNEILKEFVGFSTFLSLKAHLQIPQFEMPSVWFSQTIRLCK